MFCYYGDITGAAHRVVRQRFPLPRFMDQRLASSLPTTRAPGFKNRESLVRTVCGSKIQADST